MWYHVKEIVEFYYIKISDCIEKKKDSIQISDSMVCSFIPRRA